MVLDNCSSCRQYSAARSTPMPSSVSFCVKPLAVRAVGPVPPLDFAARSTLRTVVPRRLSDVRLTAAGTATALIPAMLVLGHGVSPPLVRRAVRLQPGGAPLFETPTADVCLVSRPPGPYVGQRNTLGAPYVNRVARLWNISKSKSDAGYQRTQVS